MALLPLCLLALLAARQVRSEAMAMDKLQALVVELRGDDDRLMRWSATEHTAAKQGELCAESTMTGILNEMVKLSSSTANAEWMHQAAEYATLCLIDNPGNRETFGKVPGIYEGVVNMVKIHATSEVDHDDEEQFHLHRLPSKAAQLVYVAVFANAANHQGLFNAGVIPPLMTIVHDYATALQEHLDHLDGFVQEEHEGPPEPVRTLPLSAMWAAAALQNLAASYCDTPSDGRCYFDWGDMHDPLDSTRHLKLDNDSKPMLSDGQEMRLAMLETDIANFWESSIETLVCHVPVESTPTLFGGGGGGNGAHERPDGELWLTAVTEAKLHDPKGNPETHGEQHADHERLETLVAWSAAGLVKNVALDNNEATLSMMDHLLPCLCHLTLSSDWLENSKAQQALLRMRRSDPCWFADDFEHEVPDQKVDDTHDKVSDHANVHGEEGHDTAPETSTSEEEEDDDGGDFADEEDFHMPARRLSCVDMHFLDERGWGCAFYEDEDVAEECDDHTDPDTDSTAREACCACGGGDREHMNYEEDEEMGDGEEL